jgi:3'-phosphoadenosine 5'-phosphosulfate sulfotransferase
VTVTVVQDLLCVGFFLNVTSLGSARGNLEESFLGSEFPAETLFTILLIHRKSKCQCQVLTEEKLEEIKV